MVMFIGMPSIKGYLWQALAALMYPSPLITGPGALGMRAKSHDPATRTSDKAQNEHVHISILSATLQLTRSPSKFSRFLAQADLLRPDVPAEPFFCHASPTSSLGLLP